MTSVNDHPDAQSADVTAGTNDSVPAESPPGNTSRLDEAADSPSAERDWFMWSLGAVLVIGLLIQWARLVLDKPEPFQWQRTESTAPLFQVDINTAGWVELIQLEGIGQGLAHRIVADREVNGPFTDIDNLTRVPGIGPKTLSRIRPWLTISHE